MKILKKTLSILLILSMLISVIPVAVFAEDTNAFNEEDSSVYSIQNDYIRYSINAKTGGFSVETLDGNPQKLLDNDIPLLYREDADRSAGTSFTTIRINGKDFVFGRDYEHYGFNTKLHTPVVSNEGRLISVQWDIDKISVVQQVAISAEADQDLTGNVGISYTVINNDTAATNVGIRVLLDTALDSTVDSPYLMADTSSLPIKTEVEFSRADGTMPAQIRGLDSITNPSKALYTFTKTWNNTAAEVDRIIVGHWRNLANTRYDYTANAYCDFTNYSNTHRVPDSAIAYYWDPAPLAAGESRVAEILYGVGNFSSSVIEDGVGINMSIDNKVRLNEKGDGYVNDGEFTVTVNIDNSVDGARTLEDVNIALSFDDGIIATDNIVSAGYDTLAVGDINTLQFNLKAEKQEYITAKTIGVTLTASYSFDDDSVDSGVVADVLTVNTRRSVVVPGIRGSYSDLTVSYIAPETVFTEGDKTVVVSGALSPLKAIEGSDGWELYLYHTTTDHKVKIEKKKVAFLDDNYTQLSFVTSEELAVGEYTVGFEFSDPQLVAGFGGSAVKLSKTLAVSNNPIYRTRTYGLMALIRYDRNKYTFVPFANEDEYNNFLDGLGRNGEAYDPSQLVDGYPDINGDMIAPFDPVDVDDPATLLLNKKEVLLIMEGSFKEISSEDGDVSYQASVDDADIKINKMLTYTGSKPLVIEEDNGVYKVSGDGKLSVVDSITVWTDKWHYQVNNGTITTLDTDRCEDPNATQLTLTLGGVGYMVQALGGFLIDLKYGVMSSSRPVATDRTLIYGISFGGSISLPIPNPAEKDEKDQKKNDVKQNGNKGGYNTELENANHYWSKPSTDFKKETNLDESFLSASIDRVLFGQQSDENENGEVVITDTGYIGIDANFSVGLPQDMLGTLISVAPGIYASVTINTIDHFYMLEAGLDIKTIQCEGVISLAMTEVAGKDLVVLDSLQFYIRDGLKIPLVPSVLYMSGLGGGIDGLADTIGGEYAKVPPINLTLFTRLDVVDILVGDLTANIALTGISLDGDLFINVPGIISSNKNNGGSNNSGTGNSGTGNSGTGNSGTGNSGTGTNNAKNSSKNPANSNSFKNTVINKIKSPVTLSIGASMRWFDPVQFNAYGNISVVDGLLTGGVSITIAKDTFYGYAYISVNIPDSIPIVGGKEVTGLEAAVSTQYIGANFKILGIKLGMIYYWNGDFYAGEGIALRSLPGQSYPEYNANAVYATNMSKLEKNAVRMRLLAAANSLTYNYTVQGQDSLIFEIPFNYNGIPTIEDIAIKNPNGEYVPLAYDDGNGGGSFLIQTREEGEFIYVSVTDSDLIVNGNWTVEVLNEDMTVETFDIMGVSDIPELLGIEVTRSGDVNSYDFDISWMLDGESEDGGVLDVYLTTDHELLDAIKADNVDKQDMITLERITLDKLKSGSTKITMTDNMESGTYYVVGMLSNNVGGMSTVISDTAFTFVNSKLPKPVKSATVTYAGDGELYVKIEDADNIDYTQYLVEIVARDGSSLAGNIEEYNVGETIYIGYGAELIPGAEYSVLVKTVRYEGEDKYYYGTENVKSNVITVPEIDRPVLLSVESNVSGELTTKDQIELSYTFDRPVWMYVKINETTICTDGFQKSWSFTHPLEDGDYIVEFKAYGESKDSVTGKDFPDVENAVMGFTVDTVAPSLSFTKGIAYDSLEEGTSVQFSSSAVFADKDGNFSISGITDAKAVLTANGEIVELGNNGTFTYSGALEDGEDSREIVFKAVDKAENSREVVIFVLRRDDTVIESVEIYVNGKPVERDSYGEATVNIRNGEKVSLTLIGNTSDGGAIEIEDPIWDILYEKNIIVFEDGTFTARLTGETAIKASLSHGTVTLENGRERDILQEDYVIFVIGEGTRDDLYEDILAAEENISYPQNASEEQIAEYREVIDEAISVYQNENAASSDYASAITALADATEIFNKAKKDKGEEGGHIFPVKYSVTVTETQNGTVTVSQNSVYAGTSLTVISTPDEGYVIESVVINGVDYGTDSIVTVPSIGKNTTVTVTFKPFENPSTYENPFIDVNENDWFYPYVRWANINGIVNGTTENTFSPNDSLTRAMMVTILWRAEGSPAIDAKDSFVDVAEGSYYEDAVAWAEHYGIVNGVGDNRFAPDEEITREQIATIMYRFATHKKYDVNVLDIADLSAYTDADSISDWALDAMKYAVASGLINGRTANTLVPQGNTTRAESVTILYRFFTEIK